VYKRCDITYNTYSRPRLQSPTRVIYLVLIQQWRQVTVPVLYLTDIEYMRYLRWTHLITQLHKPYKKLCAWH